jgi:hypothetical protein
LHAIVVLTGSGAVHCWLGRSACCCPLLTLLRLLRPAHVSPLHSWRRSRWGGGIGCQVTPLPPCLVNLRGKRAGWWAGGQAGTASRPSVMLRVHAGNSDAAILLENYRWRNLPACLPARPPACLPACPSQSRQASPGASDPP